MSQISETFLLIFPPRHDKGTDALTLVDASFIGNQCGSFVSPKHLTFSLLTEFSVVQTLGSWSETMNCYHATGVCSTPTSRPFTSGYFSPVVQGWYHICSFSRFKQGGNSNDVTIMVVRNDIFLFNFLLSTSLFLTRAAQWWRPMAVLSPRTGELPAYVSTRSVSRE